MFKSKVRELTDSEGKTVRMIAEETQLSTRTVHRSTKNETIGGCQLNTLAKIGRVLGVNAKALFDEGEQEVK